MTVVSSDEAGFARSTRRIDAELSRVMIHPNGTKFAGCMRNVGSNRFTSRKIANLLPRAPERIYREQRLREAGFTSHNLYYVKSDCCIDPSMPSAMQSTTAPCLSFQLASRSRDAQICTVSQLAGVGERVCFSSTRPVTHRHIFTMRKFDLIAPRPTGGTALIADRRLPAISRMRHAIAHGASSLPA